MAAKDVMQRVTADHRRMDWQAFAHEAATTAGAEYAALDVREKRYSRAAFLALVAAGIGARFVAGYDQAMQRMKQDI